MLTESRKAFVRIRPQMSRRLAQSRSAPLLQGDAGARYMSFERLQVGQEPDGFNASYDVASEPRKP
jgi:hypothetical protein